jgi:hypothetical protein
LMTLLVKSPPPMVNLAAPGKKAPEYLRSAMRFKSSRGESDTTVNSGSEWGRRAMDGEVGGRESIGVVQHSSPLLHRFQEVKNNARISSVAEMQHSTCSWNHMLSLEVESMIGVHE